MTKFAATRSVGGVTRRTSLALLALLPAMAGPARAAAAVALSVADQNEELQTLMRASGEQDRLAAPATYANFLGGPAILEAFRAGALDIATVGNTPPIQAQAAGERVLIVAAVRTEGPDYRLAARPGVALARLEDLKGRRVTYGEGTGRQPFVLNALERAGLGRRDVTLVPLRAADFPDAIRAGQVDVAVLNEPHYSRYIADNAPAGASGLPDAEYARLPKGLAYLYASAASLADPPKAAALRDFVAHWIAAKRWADTHPADWIDSYFVKRQRLSRADGEAVVRGQGASTFPLLSTLVGEQQGLVDLIRAAGDLPRDLDARAEFDLSFDPIIAATAR